jgi:folate-binding protein YgfZ
MSIRWIPLPAARAFSVSGKDARRYLHNRLSQDIKNLSISAVTQAAALSAQGRVEGFFSVQCVADDRFVLIADGGESETLRRIIAQYIVADRVTVEELVPAPKLLHITCEPREIAQLAIEPQVFVCTVPRQRIAAVGTDLLISSTSADAVIARCRELFGEPISEIEYYCLRWERGLPVFPDELNEQVILTECGMRDAVSFSKGCYVGQEVIERSDAIGKLPRTLERICLQGQTTVEVGTPVLSQGAESIGKIVSSACNSGSSQVFAFAMLRTGKYSAGEAVTCAGVAGQVVSQKGER